MPKVLRSTPIKGQCYKTFHDRSLRIFVTSLSVRPWEAFSDLSSDCV